MKQESRWRRCVTDPILFSQEFLGITPHPGQVKWLKESTGYENALVTGNRWGKSQIQAVKLLHRAIFQVRNPRFDREKHYRCANVSVTQDQSNIIFAKILELLGRSDKVKVLVRDIRQTPFPHIIFINGSEIWARSSHNRGESLLGQDFDYINFDEAAYEPYGEWVVDSVIKMRLADRAGMLDFSSTPNGLNWFFRRCQAITKERRGYVHQGATFENPYLSIKYLEDLKTALSQARQAQHLMGRFTSFEGRLFPEEIIQKCLCESSIVFENHPAESHFYIHGWDLARKVTHTVGVTIDATSLPYRVVNLIRMQREWPATIRMIKDTHRQFGGVTIIDSTGLGDVVLSDLEDIGAIGFNFGGGNRDLLLANLERAIFAGEIIWQDREMPGDNGGSWSLTDEIRAMDKAYENVGDGVCALALALWQIRQRTDETALIRAKVGRI